MVVPLSPSYLMEAEFAAWEALPAEHEIARPVDPPRGHSRPGNELSVTWEIASTLGASVAMGDTPEAERLVAHRWAWLASDPDWKRLFETAMTHKLADCLEAGLPEEKYIPLCAEVLECIPSSLWLDGENFDRLKARALEHRFSGRTGCDDKCATSLHAQPRLFVALTPPHLGLPPLALFTLSPSLLDSDLNCEHYTRAWVLDCVLSGIVYQMTELGVDALAPPPAEALATALSAATLSYEMEEEEQVAARHQQRHRQLLQESLALDSQNADLDSDAGMPSLLDPPSLLDAANDGRTAPTRTHATSTGPSGATT